MKTKVLIPILLVIFVFLVSGCSKKPIFFDTDISTEEGGVNCFTDASCQKECATYCASINMKYSDSWSNQPDECCPYVDRYVVETTCDITEPGCSCRCI